MKKSIDLALQLRESFTEEEWRLLYRLAKEENLPGPYKEGIEFPGPIEFFAYLGLREQGVKPTFMCPQELNLRAMEIAYNRGLSQVDDTVYVESFRQTYNEVGRERVRLLLLGPQEVRDQVRNIHHWNNGDILVSKHIDYLLGGE